MAPVDDVVVRYINNTPALCLQVKYRREESKRPGNITFAGLIREERGQSGGRKKSLLSSLACGWARFKEINGIAPRVVLYSNRGLGERGGDGSIDGCEYKRIPLSSFLHEVRTRVATVSSLNEIGFDDDDLSKQWREFVGAIKGLDDDERLSFLRCFEIQGSQPRLDEAKRCLLERLKSEVCSGDEGLAQEVFAQLCNGLSEWTTHQNRSGVTGEVARKCIEEINHRRSFSPIRPALSVSVPEPVFPSRRLLARELSETILSCSEPMIFITGDAGAGKTRIVTCLYEDLRPSCVRFHAFKPLDAYDYSYAPDSGVTDSKSLWASLLNELRQLAGSATTCSGIPVLNEICTAEQLRTEVLMLADKVGEERGIPTVIIIDGIDHAARSGGDGTFLGDLVPPDRLLLLHANVKAVIVGQPPSLYPKYPAWLSSDNGLIRRVEIPPLDTDDIVCLIEHETPMRDHVSRAIAAEIGMKTSGNTLSVVYAVNEISRSGVNGFNDAIGLLRSSGISGNVEEYYKRLWGAVKTTLENSEGLEKAVGGDIARTMHLLDGLVSPKILAGAFEKHFPEESEAEVALECLSAVMRVGGDGVYRPIHNDFRLFLAKMVSPKHLKPRLIAAASALATYAFQSNDELVRHFFGIRLLKTARREAECAEVFDTDFVIESMELGVPWPLLCEQASTAFTTACASFSLHAAYHVILAAFSLAQIAELRDYYEKPVQVPHSIDLIPSDFYVLPPAESSLGTYQAMLDRMRWLLDRGVSKEDVTRLYDVWFGRYTPVSFALTIIGTEGMLNHCDKQTHLSTLMERWGEVTVLLGRKLGDVRSNHELESESLAEALDCYIAGYVYESLSMGNGCACAVDIASRYGITGDGAHRILRVGLSNSIGITTNNLVSFCEAIVQDEVGVRPIADVFALSAAVVVVAGRGHELDDSCVSKSRMLSGVRLDDEKASAIVAWCFVEAYRSGCSKFDEVLCSVLNGTVVTKRTKQSTLDLGTLLAMRAAICLGFACGHSTPIMAGTSAADAVNEYLSCNTGFRNLYYADCFLQYVLFADEVYHLWADALSEASLKHYALSNRQFVRKLRLLDYFEGLGNDSIVKRLLSMQFNMDGSLVQSDRYDDETIRLLSRYVSKVDSSLYERVLSRSSSYRIAFTEHKDDALRHLIRLFKIASDAHMVEEDDARRLMRLEHAASIDIGYVTARDVQSVVMEWAFGQGLEQVSRVRQWDSGYSDDAELLWQQYVGLLGMASTFENLCACFCLAYGANVVCEKTDTFNMTYAIQKCVDRARELGFAKEIERALSEIVDVEYEEASSPVRQSNIRHSMCITHSERIQADQRTLIADMRFIAFEAAYDYQNGADCIELACSELVHGGEDPVKVYEELVIHRRDEIATMSWEYYSNPITKIVDRIAEHVGDEHFFSLLLAKGKHLTDYGMRTPAADVAYAISARINARCPEMAIKLFRDECSSKEMWLTAGGAIPLEEIVVPEAAFVPSDSFEAFVAAAFDDFKKAGLNDAACRACFSWIYKYVPEMRDLFGGV